MLQLQRFPYFVTRIESASRQSVKLVEGALIMTMLPKTIASSIAVLCLATGGTVMAQEAGSYAATFTKVVDNCDKGLELSKASLTITRSAKTIEVRIDTLPTFKGKAGKRGKLRAEAKGTADGLNARYGLNGRVSDRSLQAVFVAEYFKGTTPVCTQSFRVIGTRGE